MQASEPYSSAVEQIRCHTASAAQHVPGNGGGHVMPGAAAKVHLTARPTAAACRSGAAAPRRTATAPCAACRCGQLPTLAALLRALGRPLLLLQRLCRWAHAAGLCRSPQGCRCSSSVVLLQARALAILPSQVQAELASRVQVLQRYHRAAIPRPGAELEFLPGQDLQPMHYLRCHSGALQATGCPCLACRQHVLSLPRGALLLLPLHASAAAASALNDPRRRVACAGHPDRRWLLGCTARQWRTQRLRLPMPCACGPWQRWLACCPWTTSWLCLPVCPQPWPASHSRACCSLACTVCRCAAPAT